LYLDLLTYNKKQKCGEYKKTVFQNGMNLVNTSNKKKSRHVFNV